MRKLMAGLLISTLFAAAGGKLVAPSTVGVIPVDADKFYVEGVLTEREPRDRLKEWGFDVDAGFHDGPAASLGINLGYQINDYFAVEARVYNGLRSDIDYYGYSLIGKLFYPNSSKFTPYIGGGYGRTHYSGYKEPKYADNWDGDDIDTPIIVAGVRYKINEKFYVGLEGERHTRMGDSRATAVAGYKF